MSLRSRGHRADLYSESVLTEGLAFSLVGYPVYFVPLKSIWGDKNFKNIHLFWRRASGKSEGNRGKMSPSLPFIYMRLSSLGLLFYHLRDRQTFARGKPYTRLSMMVKGDELCSELWFKSHLCHRLTS